MSAYKTPGAYLKCTMILYLPPSLLGAVLLEVSETAMLIYLPLHGRSQPETFLMKAIT